MRTYCQAQVTSCHYPLNINKCIIIWWIDKALNWIKLTKGVATRSSLYWRHRNVRYNIGTMQHQITCFLMGGSTGLSQSLHAAYGKNLPSTWTSANFSHISAFPNFFETSRSRADFRRWFPGCLSIVHIAILNKRGPNGGMRRKQLLKMNRWQRSLPLHGLFVMITQSELFVELVIYYPCHNSFITRV